MKQILVLLALAVALPFATYATPCSWSPFNQGVGDTLSVPVPNTNYGVGCADEGDEVNFDLITATSVGQVPVNSITYDYFTRNIPFNPGGHILLDFNPNVNSGFGFDSDLKLFEQFSTVSGQAFTHLDVFFGGTGNSSMAFTVCGGQILASGICGPNGVELWSGTLNPLNRFEETEINWTGDLFWYKDINASPGFTVGNVRIDDGHISSITQSFDVSGQVPEPATMALLGGGLLALGLLRRKIAR